MRSGNNNANNAYNLNTSGDNNNNNVYNGYAARPALHSLAQKIKSCKLLPVFGLTKVFRTDF